MVANFFKKLKFHIHNSIIYIWYKDKLSFFFWLLYPFELIYQLIIRLKKKLYQYQILKPYKSKVPVIIVGNLTVGGTGKTPMVYYLTNYLHTHGFSPAVLMRGYKGKHKFVNSVVPKKGDPKIFGDEPVMLANNLDCPVVIGVDRVKAVQFIAQTYQSNIIICDDGLQDYRLARDVEILMIDGERYFGNLHYLPLGPLREDLFKLQTVDFIIIKDCVSEMPFGSKLNYVKNIGSKLYSLSLMAEKIYNIKTEEIIEDFTYFDLVHAVAGIGNNQKFFKLLNDLGIKTINHQFPDHYVYKNIDLNFYDDLPIIMTEKDATKCKFFAKNNCWYLKVKPEINLATEFQQHLENLIS